jgi:hypothetical protein
MIYGGVCVCVCVCVCVYACVHTCVGSVGIRSGVTAKQSQRHKERRTQKQGYGLIFARPKGNLNTAQFFAMLSAYANITYFVHSLTLHTHPRFHTLHSVVA